MRILVLVHGFPPQEQGGVERVAFEQARELVARGHAVQVFARASRPGGPGEGGATSDDEIDGVPVRRVVHDPPAVACFTDTWRSPVLDVAFAAALDEFRPDVVHVQHLVALSTRLLDACRRRGLPWVISLHDFFFLCHRTFLIDDTGRRCAGPEAGLRCGPCLKELGATPDEARLRFEEMAQLLAEAARVTAPSHAHARHFESELPFLAGRIEIVPPGLSPPGRRVTPQQASETPLELLYAGPILPHKGIDVLIEALGRVAPGRVALEVRGGAVAQFEKFAAHLRQAAAGLEVRWRPGFVPGEIDEVFARADALVLPSRCDESWSRIAREARHAGLAVVAPATGGPAEGLCDGVDALLVAPDDAVALATAIERLATDRGLLTRLQDAAPPKVTSLAEAAAAVEAILERALVRPNRRARVTVAYVVKNGLPELADSLAAVRAQQGDFDLVEILAIDSGSSDGSRAVLERAGVRVIDIPPESFGHGATRNLAARTATGELIAFLTQDATPLGVRWLEPLVAALAEDPLLAGVWSRHVPRQGCHPMERRALATFPPFASEGPWIAQARGNPAYAEHPEQHWWFSNNACLIRRQVIEQTPFPEVWVGEDQAWARAVLEVGWRTRLVAASVVEHSHGYRAGENLRRHFDHARAMRDIFGWRDTAGLGECIRGALRETGADCRWIRAHEGRAAVLRWAPRALSYQAAAWAGRWLAAQERRLPARLRRGLSLHESRLVAR